MLSSVYIISMEDSMLLPYWKRKSTIYGHNLYNYNTFTICFQYTHTFLYKYRTVVTRILQKIKLLLLGISFRRFVGLHYCIYNPDFTYFSLQKV